MDGIVFHPCPFWNPGVAGTFPSLVEKYERSFCATIDLQINTLPPYPDKTHHLHETDFTLFLPAKYQILNSNNIYCVI